MTNTTFCLLILSLCLFSAAQSSTVERSAKVVERKPQQFFSSNSEDCPAGFEDAHELVEAFLTESGFNEARQETGTSHLSPSQIQPLQDPGDSTVCATLNSEYSTLTNEVREHTYYKVGDFYFVSAPLVTKEVDDYIIASGPHFLVILNSNLEEIKVYAL